MSECIELSEGTLFNRVIVVTIIIISSNGIYLLTYRRNDAFSVYVSI